MSLEAIDFPSDPFNYTNGLRKEFCKVFGAAQFSREAYDAVKAAVEYFQSRFTDMAPELAAYLDAQAERARAEHEANLLIEQTPPEADPEPQTEPVRRGRKPA